MFSSMGRVPSRSTSFRPMDSKYREGLVEGRDLDASEQREKSADEERAWGMGLVSESRRRNLDLEPDADPAKLISSHKRDRVSSLIIV